MVQRGTQGNRPAGRARCRGPSHPMGGGIPPSRRPAPPDESVL